MVGNIGVLVFLFMLYLQFSSAIIEPTIRKGIMYANNNNTFTLEGELLQMTYLRSTTWDCPNCATSCYITFDNDVVKSLGHFSDKQPRNTNVTYSITLIPTTVDFNYTILWCFGCNLSNVCPWDENSGYCNGHGACVQVDGTYQCICDTHYKEPPNCYSVGWDPIYVIVSLVSFFVIVIAFSVGYYKFRGIFERKASGTEEDKPILDPQADYDRRTTMESEVTSNAANYTKRISENKLLVEQGEIQFSELKMGKIIGSGSFSIVYEGTWKDSPVAIKVIKGAETNKEYMLEECSIMIKLNHPNIVKFLGASLDPYRLLIVTEYLDRGSLSKLITSKSMKYDVEHIRCFLLDTANGMHYLHKRNIIHRDLKPGNLLITSDWRIKVADFGLSKALPNAQISQTLTSCGTTSYAAPELLRNQRYSLKIDVWSFGIIAICLFNRSKPYPGLSDPQIVIRVLSGKKPKLASSATKEFQKLIRKCLEGDPRDRPSFKTLGAMLEQLDLPKPTNMHPYERNTTTTLSSSITFGSLTPDVMNAEAIQQLERHMEVEGGEEKEKINS
eukprot:TRINITY_DN1946_c0_g1_i1.p1 TRINITY_DN1946_c0_g1~~TRINITY_DN1946_c0_g1_i1.p1  ORF type:complete len:558 (+),score=107.78 TRINITY_DN1946_c0_g1_i1:57-1730(+)